MDIFNINEILEEMKSAKALRNTRKAKADVLVREQKTANALKTYPFEELSPDLVLKINTRAKRMALRLDPKKRVMNLVVPPNGSMRQAYLFAYEHKFWIREKLKALPRPIRFINGVTIPLLGQVRTLKITYDETLKTTDITLKNNELLVSTNKKDPSARIKRFIIALAKEELAILSKEKAAKINKTVHAVTVKDTSSRWGSCSHDGKITYSWRLIFAPWDAMDYVVAHEVAHLKVMDHSPAFWHLCEDLSEEYTSGKSWMKRHSDQLIRYQP